jgi:3-polyprenyl-4-hydroxybenzoate decarboxylase
VCALARDFLQEQDFGEEFALASFERHAGAVKNCAFSTEAALAFSQEQNFTERNALAYF